MSENYEVLSPWAEADPVPYRGIMPRIDNPDSSKIGLFCNTKRVSEPLLKVLEDRLKKRFPTVITSWFYNTVPNMKMVDQPERKGEFEDWLKGVDTVIASYGD